MSPLEELLKDAFAKELESCVVGIVSRKEGVERIVEKPLGCYALYKGSLVDPWDTQIPLHRVSCLQCKTISHGKCVEKVECEVLKGRWAKVVLCKCGEGVAVRGPRGYDPVFALSGPPYPLVYSGQVVDCVPEGECIGELTKRGVWYWHY